MLWKSVSTGTVNEYDVTEYIPTVGTDKQVFIFIFMLSQLGSCGVVSLSSRFIKVKSRCN